MSKYKPTEEGRAADARLDTMTETRDEWAEVGRVAGAEQQKPLGETLDNRRRMPGGHDPKRC